MLIWKTDAMTSHHSIFVADFSKVPVSQGGQDSYGLDSPYPNRRAPRFTQFPARRVPSHFARSIAVAV